MVWDPFLEKDIAKIEKIQRKAARFIKNDYKSRSPGCVTKMLQDLDLNPLKDRRKEKRLCFLYNIQKGDVPAINPTEYLIPIKPKRKIKAKTFSDCETQNLVKRHQNLHSKCFQLPKSNTPTYKNSFFPRSISEWNGLEDTVVIAPSAEVFKSRLNKF